MTKYEQIMRHIQELIHTGSLRDGERIPSIRAMAGQMRVSLMTVMEAYRRLEDQGVVESRPQSGYYLRPSALRGVSPVRLPEARTEIIPMHTSAVHVPEIIERLIEQAQRHDVVPLGAGLPAAEFFPSAELGTRLARVARSSPDAMNRYCMGCGSAALICEITRWMASSGCTPLANDVVVTGGATQGLLFALRAVTRPGDTVAVESPGYFGFYALLQFLHLNAVEIPADPQTGFSVDALADVMRSGTRPACILLSANHSNPTGAVMPDDARAALVALSMRHAIPIIEDDTYGALSFDQRYPRPLKSFAPHYVLYVGSMSKILAPGYRMGWVAGGRHHEDVLRCHNMTVVSAPVATQLAVASFLHDGGMLRHLRRLRARYAEQVALFQAEIARAFPDGTRTGNPRGGHFLWIALPAGVDAVALAEAAMQQGITIAPGAIFSSRQHYRNYIRMNCAVPWSARVEQAIRTIGTLAAAL